MGSARPASPGPGSPSPAVPDRRAGPVLSGDRRPDGAAARHACRHIRQIGTDRGRQADRRTGRQTDRDRQTDREAEEPKDRGREAGRQRQWQSDTVRVDR